MNKYSCVKYKRLPTVMRSIRLTHDMFPSWLCIPWNASHLDCSFRNCSFSRAMPVRTAPPDVRPPIVARTPKTIAGTSVAPRVNGAAIPKPTAVPGGIDDITNEQLKYAWA